MLRHDKNVLLMYYDDNLMVQNHKEVSREVSDFLSLPLSPNEFSKGLVTALFRPREYGGHCHVPFHPDYRVLSNLIMFFSGGTVYNVYAFCQIWARHKNFLSRGAEGVGSIRGFLDATSRNAKLGME
eukprot:gnl/MRDRNA2_/MRDRNA2_291812_c0_seq1.p2 gnl/MRDRNA2_/MRDRNA2_291812_c0~~gnl/MRDRNA2_/MRDRNA2_291812_c0_seq1.p2  ORF type:complete len:127 (-),score=8.02 gnl/MRDRNA2_/MRDRNA2_291812_c0_seq1:488-868(-)